MTRAPRFGLFLPQHWHTWAETTEEFRLADELGYDHAWTHDHYLSTAPDDGGAGPMLEAWSLLAGLAALTSRVRLGVLVTGNTYRHPGMLAKQAVTIDHISGGRLILGMGAGWHEEEHRQYGYPFPSPKERVDRFEEALQVIDLLQREERATFAGRHYRLEGAIFEPKPVQRPRIPVLVGTTGPRMMRITARLADMWDTSANQPDLEGKLGLLDDACRAAGRDPAELRRMVHVGGPETAASPEAFLAFYERHRALGFTDFVTDLPPPERREGHLRVATETIPALRE